MTAQEIESKIRGFLKEEFMMEQIEYSTLDDKLSLDSLAQAELRVFLGDEFGIAAELDTASDETFSTLGNMVRLVLEAGTEKLAVH